MGNAGDNMRFVINSSILACNLYENVMILLIHKQGLPLGSQSSFKAILSAVSSLAMNESYLIGELPKDIIDQVTTLIS